MLHFLFTHTHICPYIHIHTYTHTHKHTHTCTNTRTYWFQMTTIWCTVKIRSATLMLIYITIRFINQSVGTNTEEGRLPHPPFTSSHKLSFWWATRHSLVHLDFLVTGLVDLPSHASWGRPMGLLHSELLLWKIAMKPPPRACKILKLLARDIHIHPWFTPEFTGRKSDTSPTSHPYPQHSQYQ